MGNLAQLLDGNLSEFNPNLSLDDQAELLPYDTKWELPIESLFLGNSCNKMNHFYSTSYIFI